MKKALSNIKKDYVKSIDFTEFMFANLANHVS